MIPFNAYISYIPSNVEDSPQLKVRFEFHESLYSIIPIWDWKWFRDRYKSVVSTSVLL